MLPADKEWLQEQVIAKLGTPASVKLTRTTMGGSATVELEASSVCLPVLGHIAMTMLDDMAADDTDNRRDIQ